MPNVLTIVPEISGVIDLQLLESESLDYEIGTKYVNVDTVTFYEVLPEILPENTTTKPIPVLDNSDLDEPIILGYNITTRSSELTPVRFGGWSVKSQLPRIDTPPEGVILLLQGETDMLETLSERLQDVDSIYGIIPGEDIQAD